MFKLASSIGFALAIAELRQRVRRIVRQGILGAAGLIIFLIGFSFLLVALHLWLSRVLNPIASAGIIGGVLVLVALILFFIASRIGRGRAVPAQAASPLGAAGATDGLGRLSEALGGEGSILRNPTVPVAALALLVGFLAGRRRSDD